MVVALWSREPARLLNADLEAWASGRKYAAEPGTELHCVGVSCLPT